MFIVKNCKISVLSMHFFLLLSDWHLSGWNCCHIYYDELPVYLKCCYTAYPCDVSIVFFEISRCFNSIYYWTFCAIYILSVLLLLLFCLLLIIYFTVLEVVLRNFSSRLDKLFFIVAVIELVEKIMCQILPRLLRLLLSWIFLFLLWIFIFDWVNMKPTRASSIFNFLLFD